MFYNVTHETFCFTGTFSNSFSISNQKKLKDILPNAEYMDAPGKTILTETRSFYSKKHVHIYMKAYG